MKRISTNCLGVFCFFTFIHGAMANASNPVDPSNQPCKGTLSGSLSLTFDCKVSAGFDKVKQVSAVGFSAANLPVELSSFVVGNEVGGALSSGHYDTLSKSFKNFGASVVVNPGKYFVNSKKVDKQQVLNLTSVSEKYSNDKGTLFEVHGTFDARLQQLYPPSGDTLTVHLEF